MSEIEVLLTLLFTLFIFICITFLIEIVTDEKYKDDSEYCYNCQIGWCPYIPKSKECQKYRKVHKG